MSQKCAPGAFVVSLGIAILLAIASVSAETLGEVNTAFKLIGPDH